MKKDLRQNNFLSTALRIPQYALLCMRSLVSQILAFQRVLPCQVNRFNSLPQKFY